ncbi:MAG: VacJ family lipoprotein [Pseudomonadota bacterium]
MKSMNCLLLLVRMSCVLLLAHVCLVDVVHAQKQEISKKSGFIDEAFDDEDDGVLDEPDPLEPLNRVTFGFNRIIDGLLLKPIATLYDTTVHETGKVGALNVVDNAFAPVVFINHTLQGEGEKACRTVFRFVINTTIGFLGLVDVASEMGLPKEPTTMNETFATWGVGTGLYIVLPLLGPSSFRDATGKLGEYYSNPLYYIVNNKHRTHNHHRQQAYILKVLYGLDAIDRRRQVLVGLRDLERMSSDFYVGMRSVYFQKQEAMQKQIAARKQKAK